LGRFCLLMRRALPIFLICLIGLFQLMPLAGLARPAEGQDVFGTLLQKINAHRAANGLGALSMNGQLTAAAQGHANYLATHPYTHPHRQNNGSLPQDRAYAAGYQGRASENVVGGVSASLDWAFQWWLDSSVHNRNMLGNWTEIGIGFADGDGYGRWYVTVFGNAGRAPVFDPEGPNRNMAPGGSAPGAPPAAPPRATRKPLPTSTPTITLTPSITYTPRPSFTPTNTQTSQPATPTAISLEVSPQAEFLATASATVSLTLTASPITAVAALNTAPPQNTQAGLIIAPTVSNTPATNESSPPNPARLIIPLLIALNGLLIGGLILRAAIKAMRT
jgi:Cysteine-rich secretory protein family